MSLERAYDPERFRAQGHALVDALADALAAAAARSGPVLRWREPEVEAAHWERTLGERQELLPLLRRVLADSTQLHHPRFVGHQVCAPLPDAALCELAAALLNNGTAVYEMGPVSTAMERATVRWLAGALGLPAGADGILTSGGSAGNLTALLAARQAKAGFDVWREGAAAGPPLAVLVSEQAHYSVARAAAILGWGRAGAWPVPVDACLKLRPGALAEARRDAERAGRRVIGVVASACTTASGSYDPLEPIADFCAAGGLWLHVDGAHGAAAALVPEYRALVRGIERADSVVWDAHKMLAMPTLITAVLFREGARSYHTFAQDAAYLLDGQAADEWYNLAHRTLECTKRMLALKLYAALAVHGPELFAENVRRSYGRARAFAALLRAQPDFELALEPEANIVCFRYRPLGAGDLDALQARLRRRLLERGDFYLVQTRLPGGLYLRTTLISPFTDERDLEQLLAALRACAAG